MTGGLNGGNGDRGGATLDPCPRAVIGVSPHGNLLLRSGLIWLGDVADYDVDMDQSWPLILLVDRVT